MSVTLAPDQMRASIRELQVSQTVEIQELLEFLLGIDTIRQVSLPIAANSAGAEEFSMFGPIPKARPLESSCLGMRSIPCGSSIRLRNDPQKNSSTWN